MCLEMFWWYLLRAKTIQGFSVFTFPHSQRFPNSCFPAPHLTSVHHRDHMTANKLYPTMLFYIMLHSAILYYTKLNYIMLCHLCYAMLCYIILYFTMLYNTLSYHIIIYHIMYYVLVRFDQTLLWFCCCIKTSTAWLWCFVCSFLRKIF